MVNKSKLKKQKVEEENRGFQEQWTEKYFVENKVSIMCMICK
jgi:hypothetical protein